MTGEWASKIDERLFERLSAYLDGELSGPDKAAFERRLAEDADLAAALKELRALNGDLRDAFPLNPAAALDGPPALRSAGVLRAGRPPERRAGGRGGARRASVPRVIAWRAAAAAALVVAVGLGAWRGLTPDAGLDGGAHFALGALGGDDPLWPVLEREPIGSVTPVGDASVAVVGTFVTAEGASCREVESRAGAGAAMGVAVACRTGGGEWEVVFAASGPAAPAPGEAITPAGGSGDLDRRLEQLLDQLGAGPLLTADEEASLMQNGWRAGAAD